MSDIAIRVENLGKQYRIGGKQAANRTFREALLDSFTAPVRWIHGERKTFETFWALDDISFEIKQGEAVGIIGRNGAGKSTLLKVLSRITKPTKGRIDLYGRVASLLEVGTGFHPELSGRDNIYLNGAILGMSRREINRKFDEVVDFSGVEKFLDTPVKHYSSGMYVRLAFAVAAHLEPEILVVDEVLAVGDAEFQKKCLGKMEDVAHEGRTVLFVSHNMASVSNLCKTAVLLQSGKIVKMGEANEIIQRYMGGENGDESTLSLDQRSDRRGDGKLRFTKLSLHQTNGNKIDFLRSGSNVQMILDYISPSDVNLKNVLVAIALDSLYGERLMVFQNSYSNGEFEEIPSAGSFICHIPKLSLVAGLYLVTIYAEVNGVIADWIMGAGKIRVETGDFYGTGKYPDFQDGKMLMEHSWSHLASVGLATGRANKPIDIE